MGCRNRSIGNIISIIISIVLAIIVLFIFSSAVVTGLVALLYTIFGFSIFALITLIIISLLPKGKQDYCVCKYGPFLLVGTLGSIVFSILTIALTVPEAVLAIFAAIVTFFIVLTILEFFLLILCIINANCNCKCRD